MHVETKPTATTKIHFVDLKGSAKMTKTQR